MSILIRGASLPKSCNKCKLDLRTDICQAFCEWKAEHPYSIRATDRLPDCPLEALEPCEDAVPRVSVEYICQKNTVSTNPYKHKYHEKFIKFMDDPEIADFGRWQHSNGFNTALVAVKCDLDKVPPVTPKQRTGKWIRLDMHAHLADHKCTACEQECYVPTCMGEPMYAFCPNCGADMRGEQNDEQRSN